MSTHCRISRSKGQVGFEQTLELEEGLFVEDDRGEIGSLDARRFKAIADGTFREALVMFLAGEPLLLRRGDDLPVPHQRCRAVMVKSGNAKSVRRGMGHEAGSQGQRAGILAAKGGSDG